MISQIKEMFRFVFPLAVAWDNDWRRGEVIIIGGDVYHYSTQHMPAWIFYWVEERKKLLHYLF